MIRKELVLKFIAISAALAMVLSLCACGKTITNGDDPQATKDMNVPDHVVPPISQTQPDVTNAPVVTDAPEASATDDKDDPEKSDDDPAPEQDDQPDNPETPDDKARAMEYLSIINSNKVHIKFTETTSYDGENVFSVSHEVFIDVNSRIYINGSVKTMIFSGMTTVVDYEDGIYYSYPDEGDYGLTFGYAEDRYTLLSSEQTDSGYSEIYSISDIGMTSTWTFDGDGNLLQVTDRSLDDGFFMRYNFEVIESSVSGMDFSIPDGFKKVDPDDYNFSW